MKTKIYFYKEIPVSYVNIRNILDMNKIKYFIESHKNELKLCYENLKLQEELDLNPSDYLTKNLKQNIKNTLKKAEEYYKHIIEWDKKYPIDDVLDMFSKCIKPEYIYNSEGKVVKKLDIEFPFQMSYVNYDYSFNNVEDLFYYLKKNSIEIKNKIKDEYDCYTLGLTKEVQQWFINYFDSEPFRLIKFKNEENNKYYDF